MSQARQVTNQVLVNTTSEMAFEAVTKASELREWFSDEAWTEVRPGGRYEVRWHRGYRAEGHFTEVDAPHRVAFTWRGSGEPGETLVTFTIESAASGTFVTVVHSGFGAGDGWDRAVAEAERGWQVGLENLQSTLETGIDLRIARRPFLGITFDVVNPELAAKEGLPVEHGIFVLATVEDSGARAAGLTRGDVILSVGGRDTPGYHELGVALSDFQAGDTVEMQILRGHDRLSVPVTLGKRPEEDLATTVQALADHVVARHREVNPDLSAAVEGLTEEEAARSPAEGEWSVKEVLAHLTLSERDHQFGLATVISSGWLDTGPDNVAARLAAVLAVTPTVAELVDRFFADEAETAAFVQNLPADLADHKARFRRIAQYCTFMPNHTCEHIDQIRDTIKALRGG